MTDTKHSLGILEADLNQALNEDEFEWLDNLLLDRVPEDDVDPDKDDEGILNLSELDGFLTAIVSNPESIMPSQWMPTIWGDFEPDWEQSEDFQQAFELILRHMNIITLSLTTHTEPFEPLFHVTERGDGTDVMIVDEWCAGYLRGIKLDPDAWNTGGHDIEDKLQLIHEFGDDENFDPFAQVDRSDEMVEKIEYAIVSIHQYFFDQRGGETTQEPLHQEALPVGRDAPCPCGSGKKFKKCCLH
jgi:uncharacterized protein